MNIRWLGHVDTFPVIAQLHKLAPDTWKGTPACDEMTDPRLSHKTMLLRVHNNPTIENWLDDLPCSDRPVFEKWKSMQRMIDRARKIIFADPVLREMADPAAPLGRVVISIIARDGLIVWHTDLGRYAERHLRFHVPLTTNPGCALSCRAEQVHMPVGSLWWFNTGVPHCATNWGDTTRCHVIFELRRRDAPDE